MHQQSMKIHQKSTQNPSKSIQNRPQERSVEKTRKSMKQMRPRILVGLWIWAQKCSKTPSTNHEKIDAEKVSQNDAKRTGKGSKMEPKWVQKP